MTDPIREEADKEALSIVQSCFIDEEKDIAIVGIISKKLFPIIESYKRQLSQFKKSKKNQRNKYCGEIQSQTSSWTCIKCGKTLDGSTVILQPLKEIEEK